jgi:hypothetical protein
VACIADGLAQNTSVKCLRSYRRHYHVRRADQQFRCGVAESLLKALQVSRMNTLEQLDLSQKRFSSAALDDEKSLLAEVLQKMTMIKSVNLSNLNLDQIYLRAIISSLMGETMALQELILVGVVRDHETLQELASHLAANRSLKTLDLSNCNRVSADGWCNFFNIIRTSRLEELYLADNIRSNSNTLLALSTCISSIQTLQVLSIARWNIQPRDFVGWNAFAFAVAVQSYRNLKKIDIQSWVQTHTMVTILLRNAFRVGMLV